ncbi:MAG: NAD(P)H:quinone oxidoreductase [Cyclobacteriaceae bacterium]|nr:NAD(P)H:quinone oxidoreductase [Cyclobacteriaceae bacterium]MCH8515648.1 NAD(P)H:quinone oxidoreductase [Cyclobacteriaceae bacterium]
MSVKVLVAYYSMTETTYELAKAIESGAIAEGAEVRFRRIAETAPESVVSSVEKWKNHLEATKNIETVTLDDLEWADAFIFGSPTRYGNVSSQVQAFFDTTGPLWGAGKLVNKVASGFVTAATHHGGHEGTLQSMYNTFIHWGAILVTPGYADPIQFATGNPYGVSFTSQNGELNPDETAINGAKFQAKRVVEITKKLVSKN